MPRSFSRVDESRLGSCGNDRKVGFLFFRPTCSVVAGRTRCSCTTPFDLDKPCGSVRDNCLSRTSFALGRFLFFLLLFDFLWFCPGCRSAAGNCWSRNGESRTLSIQEFELSILLSCLSTEKVKKMCSALLLSELGERVAAPAIHFSLIDRFLPALFDLRLRCLPRFPKPFPFFFALFFSLVLSKKLWTRPWCTPLPSTATGKTYVAPRGDAAAAKPRTENCGLGYVAVPGT